MIDSLSTKETVLLFNVGLFAFNLGFSWLVHRKIGKELEEIRSYITMLYMAGNPPVPPTAQPSTQNKENTP